MPAPSRKGIFVVLLVILLTIGVAFIPDIILEEMRTWSAETFGSGDRAYWGFRDEDKDDGVAVLTTDIVH